MQVNEDSSGVIEMFHYEIIGTAWSISVTDPNSGTKLYWSIDPSDSTTVILSPKQAAIFSIQEQSK